MSFYQKLLRELAPDVNPAGVEASMRSQYGTLNHLPREVFAEEARIAAECEKHKPGYLRGVAQSFGMGDEFDRWEAEKSDTLWSVYESDKITRGGVPRNQREVASGFTTPSEAMDRANEMALANRAKSYTVGPS